MAFFSIVGNEAKYVKYEDPGIMADNVQDALDNILTGTALSAEHVFYVANESQSSVENVQAGMDLAFFRANRLPIIESSWDGGALTSQYDFVPGAEDGAVGDFWIAADYPGGSIWPPQLYGPKQEDDSWPLLEVGPDYKFVTTIPNENTPAVPPYAWYADANEDQYIYTGTITSEPTDGATLTWSATEHRWVTDIELAPLLSGINETGSTSYTLQYADRYNAVCPTSNDPVDIVVPYDVFAAGTKIDIVQLGLGQITVVAEGASIFIGSSQTLKLRTLFSAATLICIEENAWVLAGDLEID
jgi:hypothetical protein